ncbi:MAG: acetolactate synthase small subunit [Candidatus Caldatribacteriota bacterium]
MKHTIAILVKDTPGVLARVSSLFNRRMFNIESIAAGHSEKKGITRITIVTQGDENILEQITKQLNKLIDVIRVRDLPKETSVERELALIKVSTKSINQRTEIMQLIEAFRGHIVDIDKQALTIEITGTEEKINAKLKLLKSFGILEISRTGKIALSRGDTKILK